MTPRWPKSPSALFKRSSSASDPSSTTAKGYHSRLSVDTTQRILRSIASISGVAIDSAHSIWRHHTRPCTDHAQSEASFSAGSALTDIANKLDKTTVSDSQQDGAAEYHNDIETLKAIDNALELGCQFPEMHPKLFCLASGGWAETVPVESCGREVALALVAEVRTARMTSSSNAEEKAKEVIDQQTSLDNSANMRIRKHRSFRAMLRSLQNSATTTHTATEPSSSVVTHVPCNPSLDQWLGTVDPGITISPPSRAEIDGQTVKSHWIGQMSDFCLGAAAVAGTVWLGSYLSSESRDYEDADEAPT